MRGASAAPLVLVGALALGPSLSAHRHDEYLHAARISIEPSGVRVELSLTPGIAVADAVIRDIDVNGDGVFSADEQRRYAERVLRAVSLRIDDGDIPLSLWRAHIATPASLRSGDVAIALEAASSTRRLAPGAHRLAFRNGNVAHGAVYLANALMPEDDLVAITKLAHDVDQSGLTVMFTVRSARSWLWFL